MVTTYLVVTKFRRVASRSDTDPVMLIISATVRDDEWLAITINHQDSGHAVLVARIPFNSGRRARNPDSDLNVLFAPVPLGQNRNTVGDAYPAEFIFG